MRGSSLAMKGAVLLVAVFVVFKFVAPLVTAPLPMSLIWLYLFLTTVGIVVYGTLSGESTEALLGPIFRFLSGEGLNGAAQFARLATAPRSMAMARLQMASILPQRILSIQARLLNCRSPTCSGASKRAGWGCL